MKRVELDTLIHQVLSQLKETTISQKSWNDYKYCGFGAITKYFHEEKQIYFSTAHLNLFVQQTRGLYENEQISTWKWGIVRKSASLLEQFISDATITMERLQSWESIHNPLHQIPSAETLGNKEDIFVLVYFTKRELMKLDVSAKTLKNYTYDGFDKVLRYCLQNNIKQYSQNKLEELLKETRIIYESHDICRSCYQALRKTISMLQEYYETGTLEWKILPSWGLRMPTEEFSHSLTAFLGDITETGHLASGTLSVAHSVIRRLLFCLEDLGCQSFKEVTPIIISNSVSILAEKESGSLSSLLFSIRLFLKFLSESGFTQQDFRTAVPEVTARRKVVSEGFSTDEIERMLLSAVQNPIAGKRDYAVMILAVQTGLRAIDIANLKYENIDWRANEIRIVQHKTGKPLALPLPTEAGNAIADYLLCERPKIQQPYIFLSVKKPFRKLQNRSLCAIAYRYLRRTGIASATTSRRGFHSFRRSFGTGLLQSDVPLDMIQELLGHSDVDSSKPYLSIDERGLNECALSLTFHGKAGIHL